MNLVVNKVVKFEEVHISDGYGVVETLTRSAVAKSYFAVDYLYLLFGNKSVELFLVLRYPLFVDSLKVFAALFGIDFHEYRFVLYLFAGIDVSSYLRKFERFRDLGLFRTVENGRHYLPTEFRRSSAEVDFKYLTDVHSGRNAERVKNDVERTTVFKERHIFLREYSRNNTLVTVTACHFVSDRDSSALCKVYADNFICRG